MKIKISDDAIKTACDTFPSMAKACASLGMNFQTFRKRAIELGVWSTNQSGKGIKKVYEEDGKFKFLLEDILSGKHSHYSSSRLKKRLVADGYKKDECESCGIGNMWNGKSLSLQLDHIDGNHYDNRLDNLQILCPNCHTQTETYGSKNRKR